MAWEPSNSTFAPCACAIRDDAFGRRDGAEHVGHMGDRHQPDLAVCQQRLERRHVEFAGIGDRRDAQLDAVRVAQQLPGHDVGMMLHAGDQHRLAGLQHAAAIAVRHQVERLGAVAGEHDLRPVAARSSAWRRRRARLRRLRWCARSSSAGRDGRWRIASPSRAPWRRSPRAASAPRRRCPGTPAACRGWSAPGSGSRCGCARRPAAADLVITFMLSASPTSARPRRSSAGADRIVRNGIQGLGQEGAHQDGAGLGVGNAAAAQVEQLLGIEFADRRAMAAFHVVGENLEFRLGIDLGVGRQQQRLVHLIAVGLLRCAGDLDLALEHAARAAGQHVLHRLARGAVRRVWPTTVVKSACCDAGQELRGVQMRDRAGAAQRGVDLGARQAGAEVQREAVVGGIRATSA